MYAVSRSSLAGFSFAVTKLRLFGLVRDVRVTKIGPHPPPEKPIQRWHLSLMLHKSKTSYSLDEATFVFLQILDSEPFSLFLAPTASLYLRPCTFVETFDGESVHQDFGVKTLDHLGYSKLSLNSRWFNKFRQTLYLNNKTCIMG